MEKTQPDIIPMRSEDIHRIIFEVATIVHLLARPGSYECCAAQALEASIREKLDRTRDTLHKYEVRN